ncbi:hypothetical protein J3R82DRAFT_3400 [Butyriboletus roseoflavus]|nr:hypothetical protein J3R82DRAFT_3400 [Butyriboletus roseoflavus]
MDPSMGLFRHLIPGSAFYGLSTSHFSKGWSRRASETDASKRNRHTREEPEVPEAIGEPASTASVALKADRYRPRIHGFQLHEIAKLQRWQEAVRDTSFW